MYIWFLWAFSVLWKPHKQQQKQPGLKSRYSSKSARSSYKCLSVFDIHCPLFLPPVLSLMFPEKWNKEPRELNFVSRWIMSRNVRDGVQLGRKKKTLNPTRRFFSLKKQISSVLSLNSVSWKSRCHLLFVWPQSYAMWRELKFVPFYPWQVFPITRQTRLRRLETLSRIHWLQGGLGYFLTKWIFFFMGLTVRSVDFLCPVKRFPPLAES